MRTNEILLQWPKHNEALYVLTIDQPAMFTGLNYTWVFFRALTYIYTCMSCTAIVYDCMAIGMP